MTLWLSVGTAGGSQTGASVALDVWVSGGELTVDVRNAPLAQVLHAVSEQAGIEVRLHGDLSAPITDSFRGLSLEDGVRRLARGHSLAVTYGTSARGPGHARPTAVWILGRSPLRDGPRPLPRTSAAVSRGGDESTSPVPVSGVDRRPVPSPDGGTSPVPSAVLPSGILALANEAAQGSETAVASLADISAADPSAVVRQQAVAALERLKGPAIEPLFTAALADVDVSVRVRAVRGLRGTGSETALASLARASTSDGDPEVRLAALSALMSFPGHTMEQSLVRAAGDPDARVRDAAARGLVWWWSGRRSGAP